MANCRDPRDWTVLRSGDGTGSVTCGDYRGGYAGNSSGLMQITWTGGPEVGPSPAVGRAAYEASRPPRRGRLSMSNGFKASDWTVKHGGCEGTIWCPEYRGRFKVRPNGIV